MFPEVYLYLIIPVLIFLARVGDVSLGTIRIIFVSKGYRVFAPFLAFFEIIIWLVAIQQILLNLTNTYAYIAYALGFATGTYCGMWIEEKLSVGKVVLQVITKKDATELSEELKKHKYIITRITAEGENGEVKLINLVIDRSKVPQVVGIIKKFNPHAFYTIEDLRYVHEEEMHKHKKLHLPHFMKKEK